MEYYIELRDSDFYIKEKNFKNVLEAISNLMTQTDKMNGGSSNEDRWFSWVNTDNVLRAIRQNNLRQVMTEWRFPVGFEDVGKGDICDLSFSGEKSGDEVYFFDAIAPWVEDGSFLEFQGEEGERWRWEFQNGKMIERFAKVIWELKMDDLICEECGIQNATVNTVIDPYVWELYGDDTVVATVCDDCYKKNWAQWVSYQQDEI